MEIIKTSRPYIGVMSSMIGGRRENQDTCGFANTPRGLLLVVCDGMGGGPAGKTASMIATRTILQYVLDGGASKTSKPAIAENAVIPNSEEKSIRNEDNPQPEVAESKPLKQEVKEDARTKKKKKISDSDLIREAVEAANSEMRHQIALNPELEGMGTTVAVVLINKNCATIAHVGDSRIYQLRSGKRIFRTADHSRVGEMVRAGTLSEEQARLSAYSNVITRALGIGDKVEVDIDIRPYEKRDRFVVCTDGIWGAKPERELIKLLTQNKRSLNGTMDMLNLEVENAGKEKGGGHDNYTAIILETKIKSNLKESMSRKTKVSLYILSAICALSIALNIVLLCVRTSDKNMDEVPVNIVKTGDAGNSDNESSAKGTDISAEPAKPNVGTDKIVENANAEERANAQKELDEIITEIKNIGKAPNDEQKKQRLSVLADKLAALKNYFPGKESEIERLVANLKGPRAISDKYSEEECNEIARKLEKIKK